MPIDFTIDHARLLVRATGRGILTGDDIFAYQRGVWSLPEVAGYNELIDMTPVEKIEIGETHRMRELASLSASMDSPTQRSKLAIVATQLLAFGLGRMYEAYRGMDERSTKEVGVFLTLKEAWIFLGLDGEPTPSQT